MIQAPQERKIFKQELIINDVQVVHLQQHCTILTAKMHQNGLFLWYECTPSNEKVPYTFEIFGTGHLMQPRSRDYISTFFVGDDLVFHVYLTGDVIDE
jgi:hypothetical protein